MKRLWLEWRLYCEVLNTTRFINLVKLVLAHYASRLVRKPLVWGLPFAVSMEPTTVCNLHCPECPTGNGTLNRPKGTMPPAHFKKYIESLPAETFHLNLYLQGEPFLNPHLAEFVKMASTKKLFSVVSTNAQVMDAQLALQLVDNGLSKLIVSLDGTTQDTYEKYRVGGQLHKVMDTLEMINQAKKKRHSKTPFIELQFIAFAHNEHQIKELREIGIKHGVDKTTVKKAQLTHSNGSLIRKPLAKNISRYATQNGIQAHKGYEYRHCFKTSTSMVALWNGQLSPCCMDKDMEYPMGNLQTTSWADAWNGKALVQFKNEILRAREKIDICKNCNEGRSWWL